MGQHWPSALLDEDREDGKNLESQTEGILGKKAESCSLDGQAAVGEEVADDGWVSHSGRVPQVVVILCDLPEYSSHDFPWETTGLWLLRDDTNPPQPCQRLPSIHPIITRPQPVPVPGGLQTYLSGF